MVGDARATSFGTAAGGGPRRGWRGLGAALLATTALTAIGDATPASAQQVINNSTVTVPSVPRPSPWNIGNTLTVGSTGTGRLDIVAGGVVSNTSGTLGSTATGSGTVNVTGAGARWTNSGAVTVGNTGTGTLAVSGGGQVTSAASSIGTNAGSSGTATVSGPGSFWTSSGLTIGRAGQGSLTVSNGAVVTGGATNLGDLATGRGTLRIESGGRLNSTTAFLGNSGTSTALVSGTGSTWAISSNFNIGRLTGADGTLTIENGGQVTNTGLAVIGSAVGAVGTVTVSGTGSTWSSGGIEIGQRGEGSLTISDGAVVTGGATQIGRFNASGRGDLKILSGGQLTSTSVNLGSSGVGTALVSGAGSTWTISGDSRIGRPQGDGTLRIENGGKVISTGTLTLLGDDNGIGRATVTGAGSSWETTAGLAVGNFGTGVLDIANGASVTNGSVAIGLFSGSGTATVSGAGSSWTSKSDFAVGIRSTGSLEVTDGGDVTSVSGVVGRDATGSGTAKVSGAGSTWTMDAVLTVGDGGSGVLDVLDGGSVTSAGGMLGALAGSTGVVTLTAGGSWTSSAPVTVGGLGSGTLNLGAAAGQAAGALGVFSAPSVTMGTNGRIVFNHSDTSGNYAFAAPVSGTGSVLHENGFTAFTGTKTYSGLTAVTGGTLAVDGSIASSPFAVSGTGRVIGTGTAGGLAAGSGGTVAPGRSAIGTLNVAGDVSFAAGSTYEVEIDPSGKGDLIAATGALTLTGGTVRLLPATGNYTTRTYTIISTQGGVTGTFDTLDMPDFAFVTPYLDYTALTVDLVFEADTPIDTIGVTPNQIATSGGVSSLGTGNPVYDAVLFSPTLDDALKALDALSGEIHASATAAGYEEARLVREAVLDRLRWSPCEHDVQGAPGTYRGASEACVWGQGFGAWGEIDSDGNAAAMSTAAAGMILGAEATADGGIRLGVAGGFTQTSFDVDDRRSSGDTTTVFGAVYGGTSIGTINLRAGASAGGRSIETQRDVIFTGFSDHTEASYGGYTVQGFGEAGYEIALAGTAMVEPFAGLSVVRVAAFGFTEDGGPAALEGSRMSQDLATTLVGVRGQVALGGSGISGDAPVVRGLVGWAHAFGDTPAEADLAFASGSAPYTVWGVPVAENALAAQAGLDWRLAGQFTAGVEYSGQIAEDAQSHAVKANLSIAF